MQLERAEEAVASYRCCAKGCSGDTALLSEMLKAIERCSPQWLAQASHSRAGEIINLA